VLDDLREWLGNDPFVPFRIVVTSGGNFDVTTPYQVAIGKTQFDYYFPASDRKATVRLNQLVSIETLEQEKKSA
jgi:hypothetical protein